MTTQQKKQISLYVRNDSGVFIKAAPCESGCNCPTPKVTRARLTGSLRWLPCSLLRNQFYRRLARERPCIARERYHQCPVHNFFFRNRQSVQ